MSWTFNRRLLPARRNPYLAPGRTGQLRLIPEVHRLITGVHFPEEGFSRPVLGT